MDSSSRSFELILLPQTFAISRLAADAPVPEWATRNSFFSVSRTEDELSVVCEAADVPFGVKSQVGWCVLKVRGPFVLSEVGVMAALAAPIAEAGVSLFAISTYDTDYLLISAEQMDLASSALLHAGHKILKHKYSA